jgi:hypothetical protein
MSADAYRTETRTILGHTFTIAWLSDSNATAPWENYEGHGVVTPWLSRDKHPGELVLNDNGRGSKRFYDFADTCRVARADHWGHPDCPADATPRQRAAFAARKDYEYLRGWCNDDWHYCGISVTCTSLDNSACGADNWDCCWGFESFADDTHEEYINDTMRTSIMSTSKPGQLPLPTTDTPTRSWRDEPPMPVGTTRVYDGVEYASVLIDDSKQVIAVFRNAGMPAATTGNDLCQACPATRHDGGCRASLCGGGGRMCFIVRADLVPLLALAGALE